MSQYPQYRHHSGSEDTDEDDEDEEQEAHEPIISDEEDDEDEEDVNDQNHGHPHSTSFDPSRLIGQGQEANNSSRPNMSPSEHAYQRAAAAANNANAAPRSYFSAPVDPLPYLPSTANISSSSSSSNSQPLQQPFSYRQLHEYRHHSPSNTQSSMTPRQPLTIPTLNLQPALRMMQQQPPATVSARYDLQPNHAQNHLRHSYSATPMSVAAASSNDGTNTSTSVSPKAKSGAIDDLLRCFICYSRVKQPHLCPSCSKIGCRACYVTWIEERGMRSCPYCRQSLTVNNLVNCRFMNDMVATLTEMGVPLDGQTPSNSPPNNSAASSCPTHPTQQLSYYCLTCSTSLCSDCAMFDKEHRGHEFSKLDTIYSEHVALIRGELESLKVKLSKMDSSKGILETKIESLTRKKEEQSKEMQHWIQEQELNLREELKKKLLLLLTQKNEVVKESQVVSRLLNELVHQLDPNHLPKHELIKRSADLIHHLYELHSKPLSFELASPTPSVMMTTRDSLLPPATFSWIPPQPIESVSFTNEITPAYYVSNLVLVRDFHAKRQLGLDEDERIKQLKAEWRDYQVKMEEMKANGGTTAAAADKLVAPAPIPTPAREVLYSQPMFVHGQSWRLKLYLNGNSSIAKGQYLSVFVELTSSHLQQQLPPANPDEEEDLDVSKDTSSAAFDIDSSSTAAAAVATSTTFSLESSRSFPPPSTLPPKALNKYEYRVEMLPHPKLFPQLAKFLSLEILSSTSIHSPLARTTVAEYVEQLQYTYAMDTELCALLQLYGSKIVTRVFVSNFEKGESWGYNRFFRIEKLQEEGYLAKQQQQQQLRKSIDVDIVVDEAKDNEHDDSHPLAAPSILAAPAQLAAEAASDDGDLLFKFYIRPPSYSLQSYEQRAWITQLEQQTRHQAKEIAHLKERMKLAHLGEADDSEISSGCPTPSPLPGVDDHDQSSSSHSTPPSSTNPPRMTPPLRLPSITTTTGAMNLQLNVAEIQHATSGQPASTIPTNQHASVRTINAAPAPTASNPARTTASKPTVTPNASSLPVSTEVDEDVTSGDDDVDDEDECDDGVDLSTCPPMSTTVHSKLVASASSIRESTTATFDQDTVASDNGPPPSQSSITSSLMNPPVSHSSASSAMPPATVPTGPKTVASSTSAAGTAPSLSLSPHLAQYSRLAEVAASRLAMMTTTAATTTTSSSPPISASPPQLQGED